MPATDDDEFMSALQGCDPLEETIDVYISDEVLCNSRKSERVIGTNVPAESQNE